MSRPVTPTLKSATGAAADASAHIKRILKWSATPIVALTALAFFSSATPASAGEFCRKDVTSQVVSCSFSSLEQCQSTSSGRGGDCFRDPWLPAANALAYAPKAIHAKAGSDRAKTTVRHH
jgi:hypothetical protein